MKIMLPKTTKFKGKLLPAHAIIECLEEDVPKLIKLGAWVFETAKKIEPKVEVVKEVVAKTIKKKGV